MAGKTMAYQIEYAYTSHIGKIRANNQDNFWCCGEYLNVDNHGTDGVQYGSISQTEYPLVAVFDGMGGESCGEIAAYLAAETCQKFYQENRKPDSGEMEKFLLDNCKSMNASVCDYAEKNKIRSMGTTVAMLGFDRTGIVSCNLGDSRIYMASSGEMKLLSTDHVLKNITFGKPPLTQYVGIPEDSMALEPSIVHLEWDVGMRFLVCSDGVTDMLTEDEISQILSFQIPVREIAEILLEKSLEKGGKDNITLILCEVQEENFRDCIRRWLRPRKKQR